MAVFGTLVSGCVSPRGVYELLSVGFGEVSHPVSGWGGYPDSEDIPDAGPVRSWSSLYRPPRSFLHSFPQKSSSSPASAFPESWRVFWGADAENGGLSPGLDNSRGLAVF